MRDLKPYPSIVVNGQNAVRTYKRDGLEISAAPLKEYVEWKTGNIKANKAKDLVLSKQINYSAKIKSIWVDAKYDDDPNSNPSGWLQLQVDYLKAENRISSHRLYFSQYAYNLPAIIVTPDLTIRLTPTKDVNSIWFFAKQVALIDSICFE